MTELVGMGSLTRLTTAGSTALAVQTGMAISTGLSHQAYKDMKKRPC